MAFILNGKTNIVLLKARHKPVCLLCFTTVAVAKKYNVERHYKQNHKNFEKEYPVGSRIREDYF